jgi:hypothetical protein
VVEEHLLSQRRAFAQAEQFEVPYSLLVK